jgi:hypothetical protein
MAMFPGYRPNCDAIDQDCLVSYSTVVLFLHRIKEFAVNTINATQNNA